MTRYYVTFKGVCFQVTKKEFLYTRNKLDTRTDEWKYMEGIKNEYNEFHNYFCLSDKISVITLSIFRDIK